MNFDEKKGIITGCTSGIGLATLKKLLKEGARVVMMVRNVEKASKIVEEIGNTAGEVAGIVQYEATEVKSIEPAIRQAYEKLGKIDFFVNNAVGSKSAYGLDHTVAGTAYEDVMNSIMGSLVQYNECLRVVIPIMCENGGGNIVNVSSSSTLAAEETRTYYKICKHGINALTQHVALQYGRHGIRCNAVLPGFTVSASAMNNMPKEFLDAYLKHTPLNRIGDPTDQANAIVFLLSDEASYITGQLLVVDGGFGVGYHLWDGDAYGSQM